jgi:DNA polymerase beta
MHPNHVYVPTPENAPDGPPLQPRIRKIINKRAFVTQEIKSTSPLFNDVVPILQERGLIAEHISSGIRRWQGVVRVPEKNDNGEWCTRDKQTTGIRTMTGKFRRLDLKYVLYLYCTLHALIIFRPSLVPLKSEGAGLIAFTGDLQFKKYLLLRAVKMGLYLNEFGLWKWCSNNTTQPQNSAAPSETGSRQEGYWRLIKARTEQNIFEHLDMEYIEPHRRNFDFVALPRKASHK